MAKGIQIIWTPWRNDGELLEVRDRLYRSRTVLKGEQDQEDRDLRKSACEQISAWKLRGGLPHAVESSWLLTEACLADELPGVPLFSLKAGYITAISRFATGLLDAEQDSKYKISMYAKAQQIGLPALFVDIRHEAAHGEMPSLTMLREAAKRALQWLWDDYWKGLKLKAEDTEGPSDLSIHSEASASGQAGDWSQWQGPWSSKPMGIVP